MPYLLVIFLLTINIAFNNSIFPFYIQNDFPVEYFGNKSIVLVCMFSFLVPTLYSFIKDKSKISNAILATFIIFSFSGGTVAHLFQMSLLIEEDIYHSTMIFLGLLSISLFFLNSLCGNLNELKVKIRNIAIIATISVLTGLFLFFILGPTEKIMQGDFIVESASRNGAMLYLDINLISVLFISLISYFGCKSNNKKCST